MNGKKTIAQKCVIKNFYLRLLQNSCKFIHAVKKMVMNRITKRSCSGALSITEKFTVRIYLFLNKSLMIVL